MVGETSNGATQEQTAEQIEPNARSNRLGKFKLILVRRLCRLYCARRFRQHSADFFGEIFHLRSAPIEEARSLYLKQSGLDEMLTQSAEPLVIWDVGLGAAANALAAIHYYEEYSGQGVLRPMKILSFENDL